MSPGIFTIRQKAVIGLSGASRATSGGMLATALIVYVGRQGSPLAVGLLAVFFLSMAVFAPLWGLLADVTGRRRLLLIGFTFLATLAVFAFVLARSVRNIIGVRALYAIFAVGFGPLMLSLVCALAGPDHRGRAAGFLGSSLSIGDMIGQILLGVLFGLLTVSELYFVIGAISLAGTVVLIAVDDVSQPDRSPRSGTEFERFGPDSARLVPPEQNYTASG